MALLYSAANDDEESLVQDETNSTSGKIER